MSHLRLIHGGPETGPEPFDRGPRLHFEPDGTWKVFVDGKLRLQGFADTEERDRLVGQLLATFLTDEESAELLDPPVG